MNMADRDGVIWMDGDLVPWREANVHVLTHTLHYGMGVFEGVRVYDGVDGSAAFQLQAHTDRLFDSAAIMQMALPFDKETITAAQLEVVKQNNLKSAYIRPMAFYGSEGMGIRADNLNVHLSIAAWDWGSYLGEEGMTKGIRIKTSSYTRHHVNISMCKAKANGHYINSMLALKEAVADGYDEAMLLDNEGYVAEGSGENIFLVKDGVIYTPDLTSALNGITRKSVFQIAKKLGYEMVEKRITRDEVYICDEVFFTGTAAEVTPVREVDNRTIGAGARGPVTEKIQSMFFDIVNGRNEDFKHWLTPVA